MNDYLTLTKPTIMLLVLISGATALILEGSLLQQPLKFFLVLLGLYLTGGAANALNQYFERNIDAKMSRTRQRRPLPQGKIEPKQALVFSLVIGISGILIFVFVFNLLTAILALLTILFYSVVYTLYLKPNTEHNIVIGGIAGAMAPVGAWAAATDHVSLVSWILFLIVFFWTPPHFWALALFCKEDYIRVNLPMMPTVRGDDSTLRQMILYAVILVVTSLSLAFIYSGFLYVIISSALGIILIRKVFLANKYRSERQYRNLFSYSIVYLFALFFTMVVDKYLPLFN